MSASAWSWLIPRQKILFGLLIFLFCTFFIRTLFIVSNNGTHRLEFHAFGNNQVTVPGVNKGLSREERKGNEETTNWVPKFVQFQQNYRLGQKHSVEMCVIDGNRPDFFTAIMCFIHDPAKFKETNRSVYNETQENGLCKGTNDADKFNNTPINLNKTDENYNKQKWIHLVAVRDPIERFVASFNRLCSKQAEKSICGNCGSNFSCFLNEQYEKAMMFAKDPKSIKSTSINKEFFPQNWNCEFNKHLNDYTILKIEAKDEGRMKLLNDLFFQFREKEINNDDLTYIYKQINQPLLDGETRIIEEATLEAKLRNDVQAIKRLIQLYYYDFQLFRFELPYNEEKL